MDVISKSEFTDILEHRNHKLIKYGRGTQPKVLEKDGTTIIKLFYPKRKLLSSNKIKPHAIRFCKNISTLRKYGYVVPRVLNTQYCRELKTYVVYYSKIEGDDIRALVTKGRTHLVEEVAKFLAELHNRGIFFRAIHLENLLYTADNKFALIDITDVHFSRRPLSLWVRYRNLKHLFSEPYDREIWRSFGVVNFLNQYYDAAKLSTASRRLLTYLIRRVITF